MDYIIWNFIMDNVNKDFRFSCKPPGYNRRSLNDNWADAVPTPTLEDARHYIESIDFSNIINQFVTRDKWLKCEANEVCRQYRNFLFLMKKYGKTKPLIPSKKIDEFWHKHILDTDNYIFDCQMIFGAYLHHKPRYRMKSTSSHCEEQFKALCEIYYNEFGSKLINKRYYFKSMLRLLKL